MQQNCSFSRHLHKPRPIHLPEKRNLVIDRKPVHQVLAWVSKSPGVQFDENLNRKNNVNMISKKDPLG